MDDDRRDHYRTGQAERQIWLGVLARAAAADICARLEEAPVLPEFTFLRGPEIGLVMARGRVGGGGGAFNLGEITIARCSIRDAAGRVGHGYAMGRDTEQVELIARLDAVLQDETLRPLYRDTVIAPLKAEAAARRAAAAAKVKATEVRFFTLATMRS